MKKIFIAVFLLAALLFPLAAAASIFDGNVPRAAESIADDLDDQLMMRYASAENSHLTKKERRAMTRSRILIMGTTLVNITTLDTSCALSRQMTEEISSHLMEAGYRFQELRKGSYIRFDRNTGEFLLTREVRNLARRSGTGQAILAGTYVISGKHVRFSVSLIHTVSNEVLAKASASVAITDDLLPLLDEVGPGGKRTGSGKVPNTYTRLQ